MERLAKRWERVVSVNETRLHAKGSSLGHWPTKVTSGLDMVILHSIGDTFASVPSAARRLDCAIISRARRYVTRFRSPSTTVSLITAALITVIQIIAARFRYRFSRGGPTTTGGEKSRDQLSSFSHWPRPVCKLRMQITEGNLSNGLRFTLCPRCLEHGGFCGAEVDL